MNPLRFSAAMQGNWERKDRGLCYAGPSCYGNDFCPADREAPRHRTPHRLGSLAADCGTALEAESDLCLPVPERTISSRAVAALVRGRIPPLRVLRHVRERRVAKVLPARPQGLRRPVWRERGSANEALLRSTLHRPAVPYALPG